MTRLLPLALALLAGPAAAAGPAPAAAALKAPDLTARPAPPPGAGHGGDTRCAACHTAEGWTKVTFAHDRTGFPLEGRHKDAACKACHASGTFADPVAKACAACHRDVHAGKLGQRCQRCHDPVSWAMPSFGPDAHRQTNFPLSGRHAMIPCQSCHGDARDRAFSRPTTRCISCHEADWARASAGGAAVDHDAAAFPQDCRGCHGAWRFSPSSFPQHQTCFDLKGGPHAGIRCRDCHSSIPQVTFAQAFTCLTDTADCLRCHGGVAPAHATVQGFQLVNRKCYECHRFAPGFGAAALGGASRSKGGVR